MRKKEHIRLQRLLTAGFFASAVIPAVIVAWASMYIFRQSADAMTNCLTCPDRIVFSALAAAVLFLGISYGLSRFIADRIRQAEQAALDQQMARIGKMADICSQIDDIAHKISSHLQLIQMQADWIDELLQEEDGQQAASLAECRESVEKIRQHINRTAAISRRLSDFSRKISAK